MHRPIAGGRPRRYRERMKELFQHSAVTEGITVRVAVNFLPEQSRVEAGKWFVLARRAGLNDPSLEDFYLGLTDQQQRLESAESEGRS